jgi:putative nucleotidyltransferase with HDIG domain
MQNTRAARRRLYVGAVVAAGALALGVSASSLTTHGVDSFWPIFIGLTVVTSSATLAIPGAPITFSIADTFTIGSGLLFGPAAGAVTAAIDGLMQTLRMSRGARTVERALFNAAAPAVAMWLATTLFFGLAPDGELVLRTHALSLLVFATTYFAVNTCLVAGAVAFDGSHHLWTTWRSHFLGLWPNYVGGTTMAALLRLFLKSDGLSLTIVALALPFPLILYFAFKHAVGRIDDRLKHLGEINRQYLATIETLAQAIDAKDQVTHGHIRRVQRHAVRLARELGVTDEAVIRAVEAASLLHDTGKLAIPEHILNKPGRLTPAEFEIMKGHARIGADILSTVDFPYPVVPIVRHHHENWDGTGYPDGLRGEAIPLGARILSVVDCYDALTSDRPYRPAMSDAEALKILRDRRGSMYDPGVVDAFTSIQPELTREDAEDDAGHRQAPLSPRLPVDDPQAAVRQIARPQATGEADELDAALLVASRLGRDTARETDGTRLADAVLHHFSGAMPASAIVIYACDGSTDSLVARSAAGPHRRSLCGLRIRLGEGVSGWVAANRRVMANADARLDLQGRLNGEGYRGAGARGSDWMPMRVTALPLLAREETLGVLAVYCDKTEGLSEAELRLARVAAETVALRLAESAGAKP